MATNIFLGEPPAKIKEFILEHYGPSEPDMTKVPLHFIAEEAGATMSFDIGAGEYETSTTGEEGSWTTYASGTTITLANPGDKIYFRATTDNSSNTCFDENSFASSQFIINSGKIAAKGNIQSLLGKSMTRTDVPSWCYSDIFKACTSLTIAPTLPAITLSNFCYTNMFNGCTSLTSVPEFKAEFLGGYCCSTMFQGCTSLTIAPTLPAETLVDYCYYNMFNGCTSLTSVPEFKAKTLADSCCYLMFYNTNSPFTISDKTFDEVVDLIQKYYLIGGDYDYSKTESQPKEIICSDKTMIATPKYEYDGDDCYLIGWDIETKTI